jgi:hypothetical protein
MNKQQLEVLKGLLENWGFKIQTSEQRITGFEDKSKGEFVITFQARFTYQVKLDGHVES